MSKDLRQKSIDRIWAIQDEAYALMREYDVSGRGRVY